MAQVIFDYSSRLCCKQGKIGQDILAMTPIVDNQEDAQDEQKG
jgi:hypothetical protein